jgi:hypothetical protein
MSPPSLRSIATVLALGATLAGCGKSGPPRSSGSGARSLLAPVSTQGATGLATKNTTRLGGPDPATDAAAVARAVYPGLTAHTRPQMVVLTDARDWLASLAASALAGAPLRAPLLYDDGGTLPDTTVQALGALHPTGAPALAGAQVMRIGKAPPTPAGYRIGTVPYTADPSTTASEIERLLELAGGGPPHQVIVVSTEAPAAQQMPVAGLAAESGAPILFVTAAGVPAATRATLSRLHRPAIYAVDPATIGSGPLAELARLGSVTPIGTTAGGGAGATPGAGTGATPGAGTGTTAGGGAGVSSVENAIAVSRFTDGSFGWGIKDPGHGLVFANDTRPLDAPASALLSASGDYGPLLLLESVTGLPSSLSTYLSDIQPAYSNAPQFRPAHGVYNHGWLIGDERAISAVTQAELDAALEISPRKSSSEEASEEAPAAPVG